MKMGTKSTLIILATLLLGFVIGLLASGALARQRVRRLAEMRTPAGLLLACRGSDPTDR